MDIPKTYPALLEDFLIAEAINHRSWNTIKEYGLDLQMFLRFVKRDRGGVPPDTEFDQIDISDLTPAFFESISSRDVDYFKLYLTSERCANPHAAAPGLSVAAINRKLSALNAFFTFLILKKGMLNGKNPMLGIEALKQYRKPPEALSVREASVILDSVKGINQKRDYCILLVALTCGLRVGEISALDVEDLRYGDQPHLVVFGKGGKYRNVTVPLSCLEAFEEYLAVREPEYNPCERDEKAMFLSRHHKRISSDAVQLMVKKVFKETGLINVYPHASPHLFRHSAATNMLRGKEDGTGKTDIRVIQEFLGHSSISTTQIYTKVYNADIQEAVLSGPFAEFSREKQEESGMSEPV